MGLIIMKSLLSPSIRASNHLVSNAGSKISSLLQPCVLLVCAWVVLPTSSHEWNCFFLITGGKGAEVIAD